MYNGSPHNIRLISVLRGRPQAAAEIAGSASYPAVSGIVQFYHTNAGVIVYAEIDGLPKPTSTECGGKVFGFHIHEGNMCGGDMNDPFAGAMSHYDPHGCAHPYHAGDMPPLFGNNGFALSLFLTDRFSIPEIIGRTVIIHDSSDDFTTQPSGASGTKIACGHIRQVTGRR